MNTTTRSNPPAPETLDPLERASIDELRAAQLERMRWSLSHAFENSPHYRQSFAQAGVHPDDLKSLDDLRRFPFTTKADLRTAYPFGMFALPMDDIVRVHASSGTTGKPTVVGYSRNDLDVWSEVVARSIRAAGGTRGDIVHIAYGYGLFTGGLGAHYGAERLGCTVVPMSGGQTERQVQLIRDFGASIIMVTPSYLLAIGEEFERQGVDPRSTALRIGILGAEPWTDAMRDQIEAVFDIDAVDIYGLSEIMGPGVANECVETKDGPHIWEDHFYPEIINPDTGAPVGDGEQGELVFTTLTRDGMPIIRYRTRDLTTLLPGTARPMRRMARITGRSDDMLIIRGVNVFPSQVEERILSDERLAPHYELEISREGTLDNLAVRVEARPMHADDAVRAAAGAALARGIKGLIGVTARVEVVAPGTIDRSLGKAKRIIDKRTL